MSTVRRTAVPRKDKERARHSQDREGTIARARHTSKSSKDGAVARVDLVDDRCEFHARGVRCPARRTQKRFCPFHSEARAPEPVKDTCPVCMDEHTKMRWFPCSHGLCHECLGQILAVEVAGENKMICPVCRADIEHVLTSTEKRQIDQNTRKSRREAQRELHIMSERRARELAAENSDYGEEGDDYSGEVNDFGELMDEGPLAGVVRGAFMVLRRGRAGGNGRGGGPSWLM